LSTIFLQITNAIQNALNFIDFIQQWFTGKPIEASLTAEKWL